MNRLYVQESRCERRVNEIACAFCVCKTNSTNRWFLYIMHTSRKIWQDITGLIQGQTCSYTSNTFRNYYFASYMDTLINWNLRTRFLLLHASVLRRENYKSRDIETFVSARHRDRQSERRWNEEGARKGWCSKGWAKVQGWRHEGAALHRSHLKHPPFAVCSSPFSFRNPSDLSASVRSRSSSILGALQVPGSFFNTHRTPRPHSTRAPFTRAIRVCVSVCSAPTLLYASLH